MIENLKKFYILLLIIFLTGIFTGKICGDSILQSALEGNVNIFTFIFSQAQNFVDMYSLLNNSNDYKRLEGYYTYRESGLNDLDFLFERYKTENSIIIKKAVIWVAEGRNRGEKLVDFYNKIYNISSDDMKKIVQEKIKKNEKR